mmetsp:Transcript_26299/g.35107  ORF Transcript_26299/g.35107 Transcript_26299/m.35107 type:complete len:251 (+) Transcript_26299:131-883(+)
MKENRERRTKSTPRRAQGDIEVDLLSPTTRARAIGDVSAETTKKVRNSTKRNTIRSMSARITVGGGGRAVAIAKKGPTRRIARQEAMAVRTTITLVIGVRAILVMPLSNSLKFRGLRVTILVEGRRLTSSTIDEGGQTLFPVRYRLILYSRGTIDDSHRQSTATRASMTTRARVGHSLPAGGPMQVKPLILITPRFSILTPRLRTIISVTARPMPLKWAAMTTTMTTRTSSSNTKMKKKRCAARKKSAIS